MKKVRLSAMMFMLTASVFTLTSCGGDKQPAEETTTPTTPTEAAAPEAPASENTNAATIEVEANDQMKFNVSEIKAKAGQEVTIVLKHVGTMPKTAMGHNLVILNQGVDMAAFAKTAIAAKATDYVPADSKDVLAHTKLIGGGETTEVTFTAPAAGQYDFLCSFPGHYAMMKGKFIVE
jgi:azurin